MNKYVCFYNHSALTVEAETPVKAQEVALPVFQKTTRKIVHTYDIKPVLAEVDGKEVVHIPDF